VDEKALCEERKDLGGDFEIQQAAVSDFDWLRESGIYLVKIKAA